MPTVVYITVFFYLDLYMPDLYRPGSVMVIKLFQAILVACIVLTSIYYLFPSVKIGLNILLMPLTILGWRSIIYRLPVFGLAEQRVLIISTGKLTKKIGKDIFKKTEHGLKLVGFIDDDPAQLGKCPHNVFRTTDVKHFDNRC